MNQIRLEKNHSTETNKFTNKFKTKIKYIKDNMVITKKEMIYFDFDCTLFLVDKVYRNEILYRNKDNKNKM